MSSTISFFLKLRLCGFCRAVCRFVFSLLNPSCCAPDSGVGGSKRVPKSTFESILGRPRPVESIRGLVASKLSPREIGAVIMECWPNETPRGRKGAEFMIVAVKY